MDLSDLLDTHTVVQLFINNPSSANSWYTMMTCNNPEDFMDGSKSSVVWILPLTFDERPVLPGDSTFAIFELHFGSSVTYNGTTSTYIQLLLTFEWPMTASKVTFRAWMRAGSSGSFQSTLNKDVDVHGTAAVVLDLYFTSTYITPTLYLFSIDGDGDFTLLDTKACVNITQVASGSHETCEYISYKVYNANGTETYQIKFYDPSVIVNGSGLSMRLFNGAARIAEYTYYDTSWHTYVFPPLVAYDGSAYDRAYILENEISLLQAELEEGGTIFDNVVDLVTQITNQYDESGYTKGLWLKNTINAIKSYFESNPIATIAEDV